MPIVRRIASKNNCLKKKPTNMAGAFKATATETASYIEEMAREMELLARAQGFCGVSNFLHLAHIEARLMAEEG